MEKINDLKRVLWHELGHFCIDLLNLKHRIAGFRVSYHNKAIGNSWGGGVKVEPPIIFDEIIEDIEKVSLEIVSLISGCMFQTIFMNKYLNQNVQLKNDCFALYDRCAGKDDYHKFLILTSKLFTKYERKKELVSYSKVDIFEDYFELLNENQEFLEEMNKLIDEISNKINQEFQESGYNCDFQYCFNFEELESLEVRINRIMVETSFKNSVFRLIESFKEKI